jgi:Spy/CpxP family protein refolding chaperone
LREYGGKTEFFIIYGKYRINLFVISSVIPARGETNQQRRYVMKRYIIYVVAVTAMIVLSAAVIVGCRHAGKHQYKWGGYGGPARMEMGRVPMMGRGPMLGGGPMMGRQGPGAGKAAMYLSHTQDLKLTDVQVKKLKDIETSFLKDMIDKRAKLAAGRVDLNQLLDSDKPDMAVVEKNVRAIHEISADLELAIIKGNKAADAILTAGQKKMLKDLAVRMPQNRPMRDMGGRPGMGMRGNRPGQAGRPAPSPR